MKYFHTALSIISIAKSRQFYEEVFDLTHKIEGERPELGVKFMMLEDRNSMCSLGQSCFFAAMPLPYRRQLSNAKGFYFHQPVWYKKTGSFGMKRARV